MSAYPWLKQPKLFLTVEIIDTGNTCMAAFLTTNIQQWIIPEVYHCNIAEELLVVVGEDPVHGWIEQVPGK